MKERLIILAPIYIVADADGKFDPFVFSEWNEQNELCPNAVEMIEYAYNNDLVYTLDNFMLCFNLGDPEVDISNYVMFVPDSKFNVAENFKNIKQ